MNEITFTNVRYKLQHLMDAFWGADLSVTVVCYMWVVSVAGHS